MEDVVQTLGFPQFSLGSLGSLSTAYRESHVYTVNLSPSGSLPLTDRWNSAFQMGGLAEPKRERNGVTERRALTFSTLQGEKAGLQ